MHWTFAASVAAIGQSSGLVFYDHPLLVVTLVMNRRRFKTVEKLSGMFLKNLVAGNLEVVIKVEGVSDLLNQRFVKAVLFQIFAVFLCLVLRRITCRQKISLALGHLYQ